MPKGKNKHLKIEDRIRIEKGLERKESFASIAKSIGVSTSTVSREVKHNRYLRIPKGRKINICIHKRDCALTGICGHVCTIGHCRSCAKVRCNDVCKEFEERLCETLDHAPFVCGDCYRRANCAYRHADYRAVHAQTLYETRLVESREGISLSPSELQSTIKCVRGLLAKGQSFEAICSSGDPCIKVSARTLYRYADAGILGLANIELPRKVRYKPRKSTSKVDRPMDRDGRSYADFLSLSEDAQIKAVQMDTVIGLKRDFKCILTIHFPLMEFQLHILLDEHTCDCVVGFLDWLEGVIGTRAFKEHFGVILTDRGIEFGNFKAIERSALTNGRRCRVYYCDALASHQKASCEKNHVELRKILPKKTSFEELTPYKMALISSHVNSYPRKSLGGKSPYSLAVKALPKELFDELGIAYVAPQDVTLKPTLIK